MWNEVHSAEEQSQATRHPGIFMLSAKMKAKSIQNVSPGLANFSILACADSSILETFGDYSVKLCGLIDL